MSTETFFEVDLGFCVNNRYSLSEIIDLIEKVMKLPSETAVELFKQSDMQESGGVSLKGLCKKINKYRKNHEHSEIFDCNDALCDDSQEDGIFTKHFCNYKQKISACIYKIETSENPKKNIKSFFTN